MASLLEAGDKDRLATIGDKGARRWLYPANFDGKWWRRRRVVNLLLMALFFALPWLQVGGHQAVLLDLPRRKLAFFGLVFWPQDTFLLWLLLFCTIIAVFLTTAQWGRIWCGWACPQTVFLEGLIRRVEFWLEGSPAARRKRDEGPWTADKFRRKVLKHGAFLVISSHVANTALCYFAGTDTVIEMTLQPPATNWAWFVFMAGLNAVFYLNFARFREQLCTIACPYGRWQSVLIDRQSMIVAYDPSRGEARGTGGQRRKEPDKAWGDCVDCSRCVQVCPTGIDIRDGLQMECVNCTACMDACDAVMQKAQRPEGLVRYTSLAELEGDKRRWLRPRTVGYGLLLLVASATLVVSLAGRKAVEVQVLRAQGQSISAEAGWLTNHFRARLINKSELPVSIKLRDAPGYDLRVPMNPWPVPPSSAATMDIFIRRPLSEFAGTEEVLLVLEMAGVVIHEAWVTLIGPRDTVSLAQPAAPREPT